MPNRKMGSSMSRHAICELNDAISTCIFLQCRSIEDDTTATMLVLLLVLLVGR